MKTHTLLALAVMAATGCETTKPLSHFNSTAEYLAQTTPDPSKRYFGDGRGPIGTPLDDVKRSGGGIAQPMPNLIPTPAYTPMVGPGSAQPTVVTSGNYPVTTITPTPMGGSTIVNYGVSPYRPPVAPYPYYGY